MLIDPQVPIDDPLPLNRVVCAQAPAAEYCTHIGPAVPELPESVARTSGLYAVRDVLRFAGLDIANFGAENWNPLSGLIPAQSTVLVKPNWVHHTNFSGEDLSCCVTHSTVLEAVLHYAAKCHPRQIVLGDAPIQDCDFHRLTELLNTEKMATRITRLYGVPVCIRDFRAVLLTTTPMGPQQVRAEREEHDFVHFDLGTSSVLDPVTDEEPRFRVTKYDPRKMARTHALGHHEYLIAREAIEADVVLSVPKLKTHKKAGITGALKNVIGIVAEKAYLPHHRRGGSLDGGDAYLGSNRLKALIEELTDRANRTATGRQHRFFMTMGLTARYLARGMGMNPDVEGSWSGNDTIWRTIFDLQRILQYGTRDGRLSDAPQRTVFSITDAIVAGQGPGPLAPSPLSLGMVTLSRSAAAADWCHALLMGIQPQLVPQLREAFAGRPHALVDFCPDAIRIVCNGREISSNDLAQTYGREFALPDGWQDVAREGCK